MKNVPGEEKLITSPKQIVDVEYPSDIKLQSTENIKNYIVASVLSFCNSFTDWLVENRHICGITEIIKYPKNVSESDLFDFSIDELGDQSITLLKNTENLLKQFGLNGKWRFPIMIAVLTNCLVPPLYDPVEIHFPETTLRAYETNHYGVKVAIKNAKTRLETWSNQIEFPSLIITEPINRKELIKQINRPGIREKIDAMLSIERDIGHIKKVGIKEEALLWGQCTYLLKIDGIKSWSKISDELQKIKDIVAPDSNLTVPTQDEVRKAYVSFVNSSAKLTENK